MPKTNTKEVKEIVVPKAVESIVGEFVANNTTISDHNKQSFTAMWDYVKSAKGQDKRKERIKALKEGAKTIDHAGIKREYLKTVNAVSVYVNYANRSIANLTLIDFTNLTKLLNTLKRAEKVEKTELVIKHVKDAYSKGISADRYNNKLSTILRGVNGLIVDENRITKSFDLSKEVEKLEKSYTKEQLEMLVKALQKELEEVETPVTENEKVAA